MSSDDNRQDIPFLLFVVPFAVSAVYALYLWAQAGLSATLPQSVFLEVTQSPYIFLIGFFAVIAGVIIDITIEPQERRRAKLIHDSDTLQKIAIVSLVLGAICAWYAAGFDPGQGATNVLDGRYVVVFPALLVIFSFLMLPSVRFTKDQLRNVVMILFFLGVPLSVDEIGKRNFFAGMIGAVILLVAGVYLFFMGQRQKSDSSS